MMRTFDLVPDRVLAVYAHPDDADVAAGGSLARWAIQGVAVTLVVVCDGDKGSHEAWAGEQPLVAIRRSEAATAAKVLGITDIRYLGYLDGEVTNCDALRETLVGIVRQVRPSIVLGPDPTATFFGAVYINHRDHREVGWALLDAVAPAAAMPLYFPTQGPAHQVQHLLLSGTHEPDVAVDISTSVAVKTQAVLAHASQTGADQSAIADVVMTRAGQAGRAAGLSYAETFRHVEFGE